MLYQVLILLYHVVPSVSCCIELYNLVLCCVMAFVAPCGSFRENSGGSMKRHYSCISLHKCLQNRNLVKCCLLHTVHKGFRSIDILPNKLICCYVVDAPFYFCVTPLTKCSHTCCADASDGGNKQRESEDVPF